MRALTPEILAYRMKAWTRAALFPSEMYVGKGEDRSTCTNCGKALNHILWLPSGFWCKKHYLTTPACDMCDEPAIELPFNCTTHALSNFCRDHYQLIMHPPLTHADVQKLDNLADESHYEYRNSNKKTPREIAGVKDLEPKPAGPCYEFVRDGRMLVVHRFAPNARVCTCGKKKVAERPEIYGHKTGWKGIHEAAMLLHEIGD